ncbi:MAG: GNAT family N-acetyltransferase [Rhodobacteraceae bacterium]|nr:GNAT family N-acetyltransferase [Paracoccaceae bacterium]
MRIARITDADGLAGCHIIRQAVFVGEQGVTVAEEWDGRDSRCRHYLAADETGPAGTARVMPLGKGCAKIQRVAVIAAHRGTGLGTRLMKLVMDDLRTEGITEAVLDSQVSAIPFYERLGFAAEGPEFDDAGIPHRRMRRSLQVVNRSP